MPPRRRRRQRRFIVHAARRERELLKIADDAFKRYDDELLATPGIRTGRLAKTHAQLLGMLDALAELLPLGAARHEEAGRFIRDMALQRQLAINTDHPIVAQFWERVEFIMSGESQDTTFPLNHSRDESLIAISLPEYEQFASNRWRDNPTHAELTKQLKTSKSRPFVVAKNVNSATGSSQKQRILHCWIFKRDAAAGSDAR